MCCVFEVSKSHKEEHECHDFCLAIPAVTAKTLAGDKGSTVGSASSVAGKCIDIAVMTDTVWVQLEVPMKWNACIWLQNCHVFVNLPLGVQSHSDP